MFYHYHTSLIFFPKLFYFHPFIAHFTFIFRSHFPFSPCYSSSNAFSALLFMFLFSSVFISSSYSFLLQLPHLNFNFPRYPQLIVVVRRPRRYFFVVLFSANDGFDRSYCGLLDCLPTSLYHPARECSESFCPYHHFLT